MDGILPYKAALSIGKGMDLFGQGPDGPTASHGPDFRNDDIALRDSEMGL